MINNSFFSTEILRWFRENGRDLPWRETKDPYAIWLSEIILQQTRIVQGWEYWERFMQTYPKVEDLAAASEDDVLKLWQGLGYYSRARNLHAAAKQIVALGDFPNTLEGIKSLKGVGDYTAAAIGSFAFDIPAAVKVKTRHLSYIYIRCKSLPADGAGNSEPMIAIHRRGEGDIWQGLWEPYNVSDVKELPSFVKNPILLAKDVKHVLTHRILLADFYLLETETCPQLPDDYIWIKESEIEDYGVPRLIEIMLEKINPAE